MVHYFFASVSPVYCKNSTRFEQNWRSRYILKSVPIAITQIWTRLPSPMLCARRQHRVLAAITNALRSKLGGIPNWGHSELGRNRAVKTNRLIYLFIGHFSSPGLALGRARVSVCVCVRPITVEWNDLWRLQCWLILTLSRSSLKVTVIDRSPMSQDEKCSLLGYVHLYARYKVAYTLWIGKGQHQTCIQRLHNFWSFVKFIMLK